MIQWSHHVWDSVEVQNLTNSAFKDKSSLSQNIGVIKIDENGHSACLDLIIQSPQ